MKGKFENIARDSLSAIFIILTTININLVEGCRKIYVGGASRNYYANGYYYYYSTCDGKSVWQREYDLYGPQTYVSFRDTGSYFGWIIRTSGCSSGVVVAYCPNTYYYSEPYDIPSSYYWYEIYNGISVVDYDLRVQCVDDDLNGWEIFGIVVGCICGVVLLIAVLAAIARCHKKKKQQRANNTAVTAAAQAAPAPVIYDNHTNPGVTITTISTNAGPAGGPYYPPYPVYPMPTTTSLADPTYSTIDGGYMGPPKYDATLSPPPYNGVQQNSNHFPGQSSVYVIP